MVRSKNIYMLRLIILISVALASVFSSTVCGTVVAAMSEAEQEQIQAVDFEIYGKVQGVFFRKYTKIEADRLNIRGWCQNTVQGTVKGHIEGPSTNVTAMMQWLRKKGSPKSIIERAEFGEPKEIRSYNCQGFRIIQED